MRPIPGTITDPAMTRLLDGKRAAPPQPIVSLTAAEARTVLTAMAYLVGGQTQAESDVRAKIAAALASQK